MTGAEEFFILTSEYRMLISRISMAVKNGIRKEHPDMQRLIHTEQLLCAEIDKRILIGKPALHKKYPDAEKEVYDKYKIPMV